MTRPDWVHCIQHSHPDLLGTSWCGRDVRWEWAFRDVAHAAETGRTGGRLVACRECLAAVERALRNGFDDPNYPPEESRS